MFSKLTQGDVFSTYLGLLLRCISWCFSVDQKFAVKRHREKFFMERRVINICFKLFSFLIPILTNGLLDSASFR